MAALVFLAAQNGNRGTNTSPTPTRASTNTVASTSTPYAPASTQPVYYESKPAPGYGQSLSENEIRYCLAEDIRTEAESAALAQYEQTVNQYRQADVDRYNGAVAAYNARTQDFNSRCSHYRYYESAMTRAKSDVENRRPALVEEGRSRFLGNWLGAAGTSRQSQSGTSGKKVANNKSAASTSTALTVHVYKCKLENGLVQYSNRQIDNAKCEVLSSN